MQTRSRGISHYSITIGPWRGRASPSAIHLALHWHQHWTRRERKDCITCVILIVNPSNLIFSTIPDAAARPLNWWSYSPSVCPVICRWEFAQKCIFISLPWIVSLRLLDQFNLFDFCIRAFRLVCNMYLLQWSENIQRNKINGITDCENKINYSLAREYMWN